MFNFAWSELAVIVAVALILIGPKDMPVAIRAMTGAIKKARRMASEFQGHVDEMVREANLEDVRDTLSGFRGLNVANMLERTVDPDGSLRGSFTEDGGSGTAGEMEAEPVGELSVADMPRPDDADPAGLGEAPAFVPPALAAAAPAIEAGNAVSPASAPPSFVPPDIAARGVR
ncbi:MAG: twin-arginine translocase subunit TatB [Proteobacteria bacterium]|nr:twin-arginine translocase subunit TatB [Pseudomonadota bacterium]